MEEEIKLARTAPHSVILSTATGHTHKLSLGKLITQLSHQDSILNEKILNFPLYYSTMALHHFLINDELKINPQNHFFKFFAIRVIK